MSPGSDRRIPHALERLAFGPRPGDAERLSALGLEAWIELQLRPGGREEAVERRLAAYPSLAMTAARLIAEYPKLPRRRLLGAFGRETAAYLDAGDLPAAKVLRAALAERQLREVLTDFWLNHFNVSRDKHLTYYFAVPFERDVVRPRVLGRFRDLLGAAARSPAMLAYFDNAGGMIGPNRPSGAASEVYARELLRLHTLGPGEVVSQSDVTSLARMLSGWGIRVAPGGRPGIEADWAFRYDPSADDGRPKTFLGRRYAGDGERDGERALDALASHPATARWIALKLCRRFVADDPPPPLVERTARRFLETDGDLAETCRALFLDPAFWDEGHRGAKLKTPFELEVSALRAGGSDVPDPAASARRIERMGMPLYRCSDLQGWPDRAEAWINPGALGARRRAARELAALLPRAAGLLASMDFQRR